MNSTDQRVNDESSSATYEENLLRVIGLLVDNATYLISSIVVCGALALAYVVVATPVYKAQALLQVEDRSVSPPGLEQFGEALGYESATQTEIEILQSRSILSGVAERKDIRLSIRPKFFPILGDYFFRKFQPSREGELASAVLGMSGFAWGGEVLNINYETLKLPNGASILKLKALGSERFEVTSENSDQSASATVGDTLTFEGWSIDVTKLNANAGTEFTLSATGTNQLIRRLRRDLSVTELGRQTGLIRIEYLDTKPSRGRDIVGEVSTRYVTQNISRLSEEADNSLNFINTQIPALKSELQAAEDAFNQFASENQSIDVSAETQATLDQATEIDTKIQELELKRLEASRLFTENHPNRQALETQYSQLIRQRNAFEKKIAQLPDTQQQLVTLKRRVDVAAEIYQLLLYKSQEVEVVKASTVGNVRIIDEAWVDRRVPVAPRKGLMISLGLFLGMVAGLIIVFGRGLLFRGVVSAEPIESLGLPVFSTIPLSEEQARWDVTAGGVEGKHKHKNKLPLLAEIETTDQSIEMIRNLRTSLYFNLTEAHNSAVMITGPSPGVGKSFIAANLAVVCALAGQKVLLVDADMRRGYLNRYFSAKNQQGLSDFLAGTEDVSAIIKPSHIENLHFVNRGKTPANPAELLAHDRFKELIKFGDSTYDVVIVDTPPVLAVTDATVVCQEVGNSLIVCRFEKTTPREIDHTIERLTRHDGRIAGAVLNGVEKRAANYYGYGGYYGYGYGYGYKSDEQ